MLFNKKHTANFRLFRVLFLIFLSLLSLVGVQCVRMPPGIVQPVATVGFNLSASSRSEAVSTVNLAVSLSAASSQTVSVNYAVTVESTANNTTHGSGKDYTLAPGKLTFAPGIVTKFISISIVDDSINEADETIKVKLFNATNAIVLTAKSIHTYTIIDNDRKALVDVVKNFGATGNGITDDTNAIQRAINTTYRNGGGVILFPPGTYIVKSVELKENITYQGYGAIIKRPAMQGKWTRTFTTESLATGTVESKPLIIKGLTFDGNMQHQGAYKKYELEQAHLIFLTGNPNSSKRLQAVVEDCTFKDGVADGISVYVNADVKVYKCIARNVFRGGFVLTGGYSSAEVYNLTTGGKVNNTGIDIEVDGKGYGDTYKVDIKLENLNLIDGDFDVDVQDGSTVIGNNIVSDAPFRIFSQKSTMQFTNSKFKVGAADGYTNRILLPYNVTFENSEFSITRKETGEPYKFFGLDVTWQLPQYGTQQNQTLVFNNCNFKVDRNIRNTDTTYALYLQSDSPANNDILKINGGSIAPGFTKSVFKE